ncbi:hypothetical protein [Sphingobium sp.]|uniref:hypothetical protein n=1 Tax=Sphingobium TaxID=165695 RepID=UPI001A273E8B|nr:hypothetical protein [Sphingobium sp.]MBJ7378154.1 hypothetical protein [Sphingobium sp.]
MMFAIRLMAIACCVTLPGCAGLVTAWKSDPLQVYAMENPAVYTMTGDRRTAVLMDTNTARRFCAESLPDAAVAYGATSTAGLTAKGIDAKFSDAVTATLLQTFQRTQDAEIYRQMGWNSCLAWAQGAITSEQYHALLQLMVTGGLDTMKKRAEPAPIAAPAPSPAAAGTGPVKAPVGGD